MSRSRILLLVFSLPFFLTGSGAAFDTAATAPLGKGAFLETPDVPVPYKVSAAPAADWRAASGKYSSKTFKPPPQRRLDTEGSELVMLQGFHWYADDYWQHPPRGWWGELAKKAPEVAAAGFDLVWFPPVSVGSYYPKEWYNLDSQWGKKEALTEAIRAMHKGGVKVLADVVLNHRNGTTNWLDFTSPDWPSNVIVNDDEVWAQPPYAALPRSLYGDEGQGDFGCRDLDHKNPAVQEDTRVFMRWLRHTIGFDGWRYDMVKGYAASHIEDYNTASSPEFTVGEYYDTDRQQITSWIDGTDSRPGKVNASTAFDFTQRYALVGAVESERYELLNDNGRPSGVIGWWPAKAVTYVESHDTSPRDPSFIQNASAEYRTQRLMGYAYILTHPGIPCVFWPHFFDWGPAYRAAIARLILVRKAAGVNSTSPMQVLTATNGLYAATVAGKHKQLVLKLGKNWGWSPGDGWTLEASGERYAVWSRPAK
ncbi:MAG: alpha-amylase family glycosyl hydrolase [Elusimicrobiales bacterium]|nr:alpha-amylase family glycosyl hydrolase [Elusimicrobiales bacterium]